MKTVLAHVFTCKRAYARLPLFERMRDESIDPLERLAFYPGMAHFILSFADINKYMLRYEQPSTPLEAMINTHTFEDDHHWPWYLEDLAKLGFDVEASGSSWMRFLWSDELRFNRISSYRLAPLIAAANDVERLAVIEAIEETGNVLFTEIEKLARVLSVRFGTELRYCGDFHSSREAGHAVGADLCELARMQLSEDQRRRCVALVDATFELFTTWAEEMLRYAIAHPAADGLPFAPRRRAPVLRAVEG